MAIITQNSPQTASMQLQQRRAPNPLAHLSRSTLLTIITPALTNTLVFFGFLQLFLRSYALTTLVVLLSHSFSVTRGLMFRSLSITTQLLRTTKHLLLNLHKRTEPLRQKLFFEFMVFILNPGLGHGLCVVIFWPGWLLVLAGWLLLR